MNTKYYTLAQAREALPKVKRLMQVVQEARDEILRLRPEAWPALRNASMNGGSREAGEVYLHYQHLEAGVKAIMGMGIVIKDVDAGLIDFLGKRAGRDVYLCWKYGEEDILYWHDLDTGFGGRHPIDGRVV